jgi:hypothetical protein
MKKEKDDEQDRKNAIANQRKALMLKVKRSIWLVGI